MQLGFYILHGTPQVRSLSCLRAHVPQLSRIAAGRRS